MLCFIIFKVKSAAFHRHCVFLTRALFDHIAFRFESEQVNPLWHIGDFDYEYFTDGFLMDTGNYKGVSYTIQMRRRSGFFVANILVPSILINHLSMATFFVPTEEKIGFSVNIFLAQTVNLMTTYQFIPHGGTEIPIWNLYLAISIVYLTTIILLNVAITKKSVFEKSSSRLGFFGNIFNKLRGQCISPSGNQDTAPSGTNSTHHGNGMERIENIGCIKTGTEDKVKTDRSNKLLLVLASVFLTSLTAQTLVQMMS